MAHGHRCRKKVKATRHMPHTILQTGLDSLALPCNHPPGTSRCHYKLYPLQALLTTPLLVLVVEKE